MDKLVQDLERLTQRFESLTAGAPAVTSTTDTGVPPAVSAFDQYYEESVKPFKELSTKIGGDAEKAVSLRIM